MHSGFVYHPLTSGRCYPRNFPTATNSRKNSHIFGWKNPSFPNAKKVYIYIYISGYPQFVCFFLLQLHLPAGY